MGLIVMVLFRFVGSKINAFISIFAFWLRPVNLSHTVTSLTSQHNCKLCTPSFCTADFCLNCQVLFPPKCTPELALPADGWVGVTTHNF